MTKDANVYADDQAPAADQPQAGELGQAHSVAEAGAAVTSSGNTRSHVVAGRNGGTLTPIRSPERAREMQRLGQVKKQRIIREGLTAAARQSDQLPADATHWDWLRLAAEQHGAHALNPGERGSNQSLKWAVEHAYPKPDRDQAGVSISAGDVAVGGLTFEQARELLLLRRQAQDSDSP